MSIGYINAQSAFTLSGTYRNIPVKLAFVKKKNQSWSISVMASPTVHLSAICFHTPGREPGFEKIQELLEETTRNVSDE